MRFIGSDAVLGLWCSPVSGETPLHGTELTYADIAPLHLPYNARIKTIWQNLKRSAYPETAAFAIRLAARC